MTDNNKPEPNAGYWRYQPVRVSYPNIRMIPNSSSSRSTSIAPTLLSACRARTLSANAPAAKLSRN
jgi:hypothetical protein